MIRMASVRRSARSETEPKHRATKLPEGNVLFREGKGRKGNEGIGNWKGRGEERNKKGRGKGKTKKGRGEERNRKGNREGKEEERKMAGKTMNGNQRKGNGKGWERDGKEGKET